MNYSCPFTCDLAEISVDTVKLRKVNLYTAIANLHKLKRKILIFYAISDGLCVLF